MVENLEKKYEEILKWGALQGITDTPFPSSPSSSPPSSSSSSYRPDFEQQQEQSSCLGFSLEIAVFSDSEGGCVTECSLLKFLVYWKSHFPDLREID
jgi:hypothetical protein